MLIVLIGVEIPSVALGGDKWEWSENIKYQENHDPSQVWLADGRKLSVDYGPIPWEVVDLWPRSKDLILGYSKET